VKSPTANLLYIPRLRTRDVQKSVRKNKSKKIYMPRNLALKSHANAEYTYSGASKRTIVSRHVSHRHFRMYTYIHLYLNIHSSSCDLTFRRDERKEEKGEKGEGGEGGSLIQIHRASTLPIAVSRAGHVSPSPS